MNKINRCLPLLGSFVEIYIQAETCDGKLIKASQKGFEQIKIIQKSMSYHDPQSELSHINLNALKREIEISENMLKVMNFSQNLSHISEGLFDVTTAPLLIKDQHIPNHSIFSTDNIGFKDIILDENIIRFTKPLTIDLGGIAKGYAVDLAMQSIVNCFDNELQQVCINAGGDLKYYDWKNIKILIPTIDKNTKPVIMQNCAIATSSIYYKQGASDIYNPMNQKSANLAKTISVFAKNCMTADALTKLAALSSSRHKAFDIFEAQVVLT